MTLKFTDGVIDIDKSIDGLGEELEIGENGEHSCNVDWEESAGHIDGTDGTCMCCGKGGLI